MICDSAGYDDVCLKVKQSNILLSHDTLPPRQSVVDMIGQESIDVARHKGMS